MFDVCETWEGEKVRTRDALLVVLKMDRREKMFLLLLKCGSTFVWCILWWGLKDIRCLWQHIHGRRRHKSATENISFQVTMVRLQWSLSRYNGQWSLVTGVWPSVAGLWRQVWGETGSGSYKEFTSMECQERKCPWTTTIPLVINVK